VSGLPQWNVVATIAGSDPAKGDIIVGAHYDSQSSIPTLAPGADDNASGTAAILEMARALLAGSYQPLRSFRFVAFAAEELGLHGSEWFASRVPTDQRSMMLMLNFDMIGTRRQDTTDRDVHIVYYDHAVAEAGRAVSTATLYTTLTPVTTTQHRPHSDSWPFATRGIPCVFYIERDFSPYYHSPRDSSTYLDMAYATEVTKAGLAMVLASDAASSTSVTTTDAPDGWELLQNFPNPFNGETVIRYRVSGNGAGRTAEREWTKVSVHDLLGREIAVLSEGESPTGHYELRWQASGYPSGVYVVTLIAAAESGHRTLTTRKMILMK
jgi:Zn-dependent M28 family amino/carboxypeptidase